MTATEPIEAAYIHTGDRIRWGALDVTVTGVDTLPGGRIVVTHTDPRPSTPDGATLVVQVKSTHTFDATYLADRTNSPPPEACPAALVREYLAALDDTRDWRVTLQGEIEPPDLIRERRSRRLAAAEKALRDATEVTR